MPSPIAVVVQRLILKTLFLNSRPQFKKPCYKQHTLSTQFPKFIYSFIETINN